MKRGGGTDVESRDCRGRDGSATPLASEEAGINYIVGACIIGFIIGDVTLKLDTLLIVALSMSCIRLCKFIKISSSFVQSDIQKSE